MGGIHACMVAALSQVPVACVAMLPPRSAAVAYCDGALSTFVDIPALQQSHACDSVGVPLVSAVAAAYGRDDVYPNTPSMFAHLEAPSSVQTTFAEADAAGLSDEQSARHEARKSWLPPLSGAEPTAAEEPAVQAAKQTPRSPARRAAWLRTLLPQLPSVRPQVARLRQLRPPRALVRASHAVGMVASRMNPRALWPQRRPNTAVPPASDSEAEQSSFGLPFDDVPSRVDASKPGRGAALRQLYQRYYAQISQLATQQQVRKRFLTFWCICASDSSRIEHMISSCKQGNGAHNLHGTLDGIANVDARMQRQADETPEESSHLVVDADTNAGDGSKLAACADHSTRTLATAVARDRYAATLTQLAAEAIRASESTTEISKPESTSSSDMQRQDSTAEELAVSSDATESADTDTPSAATHTAAASSRFDLARVWPRRGSQSRSSAAQEPSAEEAAFVLSLLALVLDCYTDVARYPRCVSRKVGVA